MDYHISKLHSIFCESKICDEAGLTVEELHQISAPNELKEMLKLSKEWHLQKDHYVQCVWIEPVRQGLRVDQQREDHWGRGACGAVEGGA